MSEYDRLRASVHSMTACILDAQPGFSDRRSTHDPIAFEQALRFTRSQTDREEVVRRASLLALEVVQEQGGSAPLVLPEHLTPVPEDVMSIYRSNSVEAA